jgi:hypothetical protein
LKKVNTLYATKCCCLSVILRAALGVLTAIQPSRHEDNMATNPPKGHSRKGAIRDRSQVQNPITGNWTKRHADTGRFIDQKTDGKPFKGVRKEDEPRK